MGAVTLARGERSLSRALALVSSQDIPFVDDFEDSGTNKYYYVSACKQGSALTDFEYISSAMDFSLSCGVPHVGELLRNMKEDLEYLTLGRVQLEYETVEERIMLLNDRRGLRKFMTIGSFFGFQKSQYF